MEDKVFPSPAVAELMKASFVEARLHTDAQNTLTGEQFATNKKAQADIAGTIANPFFVVVDPKTGAILAKHKLSGGFGQWGDNWKQFLQNVLKQADR